MNPIQYLENQITLWNAENKCGFCWSFGAPLSDSGMNATNKASNDECCVHVYVTKYAYGVRQNYVRDNPHSSLDWVDHNLTVNFVKNTNLGINVYSEQEGHPIEESHWKMILEPLQTCLKNGDAFDFCDNPYRLESFNASVMILKGDQNYTGWSVNLILREYIRR